MHPKKPLAWGVAMPAPEGQVYGNASAGDACVELAFPYLKNSKRFWYFELNGERWLHKNNCVSAEVVEGTPTSPSLRGSPANVQISQVSRNSEGISSVR